MFKKVTLLVFLIMFIFNFASAQNAEKGITGKGVKLGIGFSYMSTEYDDLEPYFEYKIGFHGGAFLTYQLSPKFDLQPEFLVAVKGINQGGILSILDWSLNYLEVPVLIKYKLTPDKKFKTTLYMGPQFSYLLSSEFDVIFMDPIDVTEAMKRLDFGLVLGGDINYKRIVFEARYTLGLRGIVDKDGFNELTGAEIDDFYYLTEDPVVKNNFLSFMFGFKF